MSFLGKGPKIDLKELKAPDFLVDLYYDLRERRLLPFVALLAVAIVVVPIALSQSSESELPEAGSPTEAVPSAISPNGDSGQLVAKFAPRLREYERRLRHLRASDPFEQQYAASEPSTGDATGSEGETSSSSGSESATIEPSGSSSEGDPSSPSPESSGEPTPGQGKLTYFSYAIDVRVVDGANQDASTQRPAGEPDVRRNLPELTMLPSRKAPAAVYMGSTKDGKKALMLISSNVNAIFGDGKCVLGSGSCELLAMEPGVPETFVYGGNNRTFKIELLKIHLVKTDKLNRAPLGKPPKRGAGHN